MFVCVCQMNKLIYSDERLLLIQKLFCARCLSVLYLLFLISGMLKVSGEAANVTQAWDAYFLPLAISAAKAH